MIDCIETILTIKKPRGFTLVELLVALAIAAVLVTLAAPSFVGMIRSNYMTSTINSFLADLRFARSEAIRSGGGVVMCRSANPDAATPSCGSGSTTGWESGWIIFHDLNSDLDYASTEPLLRVQGPLKGVNSISEAGAATKFQFTATGQLRLSSITSIVFGTTPDFVNSAQRLVCVSVGGRGKVAGDGTATCS